MRIAVLYVLLIVLPGKLFSRDSLGFFARSPELNKPKFISVVGLQTAGYGGSLVLLSNAWYKDYNQTPFHYFNDSPEWLQMDKAGHFVTSWYLGRIGTDMHEWSGVPKRKAVLYGTLSGWAYLTGIEILDGFSGGWGFSWSDITANSLGTGLILGQELLANKRSPRGFISGVKRISLKFSFHETVYPAYRLELLGKNIFEQVLKDYNGQTYWVSCNISSFLGDLPDVKSGSIFPRWLNIAVGYGAEGMISGKPGYAYLYPDGSTLEFERYRQYYLSLDIDLSRIKTKSHFVKMLAETFCFIKIPAPALEINKNGFVFHPLYH